MSTLRQIGEVADRVGLSLRTVRYYEEAGLVRPSERTNGGFRLYGDEEISRLELIKQMKPLGFSIQEMRELLDARDTLLRSNPEDKQYEPALERLGFFAAAAKAKCDEMAQQFKRAKLFETELERELRRHRRAAKIGR